MTPARDEAAPSRGEHGFTLVELIVAMAASIVVMIGLTSILIVSLHQTQRTFTKVDATRRARTAIADIENELHSACVNGDPPIQAGSDPSDVSFLSYSGTAANPTPVWHTLSFSSSAGTLTDTTYAATYNGSGTGSDWTRGSQLSATKLLTNVSQVSAGTPVFQYFAYKSEYTDSSGNTYWTIPDGTNVVPITNAALQAAPLNASSGLSASDADSVVEVVINLLVGASSERLNNTSLTSVSDPVTDSISLRITTPPDFLQSGASSSTQYAPCQ